MLRDVNLHVGSGEIVAIIGANGAGKSTLLKAISGLLPASQGSIRFEAAEITRLPPHRIVAAGIAQVPEGRQLFADMTVEDNLRLGAWTRRVRDPRAVFALFPPLVELRRRAVAPGVAQRGDDHPARLGQPVAPLLQARRVLLHDRSSPFAHPARPPRTAPRRDRTLDEHGW